MSTEFADTIKKQQSLFGITLSDEKIGLLERYYEVVLKHNEILHLVAPCSAEEFATRHVLESLTLLKFLPKNAIFADIGTGAGLPGIPCLIARDDLKAYLIESKVKKSAFLTEAAEVCGITERARIVNQQFEEFERPRISYLTCRALDKFTQKFPDLLNWSKGAKLLLFGGNSLREEFYRHNIKYREILMPLSEQRYLFVSARKH
jgi:16S rRNA (guanine(527)-N(7))-methyltransferase RsmG